MFYFVIQESCQDFDNHMSNILPIYQQCKDTCILKHDLLLASVYLKHEENKVLWVGWERNCDRHWKKGG